MDGENGPEEVEMTNQELGRWMAFFLEAAARNEEVFH